MGRKAAVTKRKAASKARLAAAGRRGKARRAASAPVSTPSRPPLQLPGECTLRDAAALKALLIGAGGSAGRVAIAGGAVSRIDAAGLQLLVAFARREQAAGRSLHWQSASAELREASARLGLTALLQLPGDAA